MAKAEDIIKEQLLKEMEDNSTESVNPGAHSPGRIIENYRVRVRRLKWIAATSWIITFLYWVAMHTLKDVLLRGREAFLTRDEMWLISYSDMGLKTLVVIAVLLTYLYHSKSKTLTVLQIYTRLAKIEEHLKELSRDK
ncbi:MAG: hypothetical protein ACYS8Z_26885 [Planctomycetota bacterium]|jgi:hypothetical protein